MTIYTDMVRGITLDYRWSMCYSIGREPFWENLSKRLWDREESMCYLDEQARRCRSCETRLICIYPVYYH